MVAGLRGRHKKTASDLHHTATTCYPCCVPTLGDSQGAGCVGLAGCKNNKFFNKSYKNIFVCIFA